MHVEETTVHINDFAMLHENNVRLAWKIGLVKSVAITHRVNNRANYSFWLSVATLDPRHIEASGGARVNVHQITPTRLAVDGRDR